MTAIRQNIKNQIDNEITNKTLVNTITPTMVGSNMKSIVDLFPNLTLSYEGGFDSTTIPLFSDGVMNVYRVTENFTYNTVVLKIGNIIGLTSTTLILIADNQKELLQNQLDAINSSTSPSTANPFVTQSVLGAYVKKINTTLLPDVNGNIMIPNANETTTGLISNGGTQLLSGNKEIKGNGNNDDATYIFRVKDSTNLNLLSVGEKGTTVVRTLTATTGNITASLGGFQCLVGASGNQGIGKVYKSGNLFVFGDNTILENSISLDVVKSNVCVGNTVNGIGTTEAKFEVKSLTKVSVAHPKMSMSDRTNIPGVNLVEGGGVYITDAGDNKGLWIYEGALNGWKQYAKLPLP